jgi:hypothetical protein
LVIIGLLAMLSVFFVVGARCPTIERARIWSVCFIVRHVVIGMIFPLTADDGDATVDFD